MAEPPNSSSSAAASAVAGPDIGPKLPSSIYRNRNRFRILDYMWKLLHNYLKPYAKIPTPYRTDFPHYYSVIDATFHGSQLPGEFPLPDGRLAPPTIEVLDNIMIVLASTGRFTGTEATTSATAYDNFLPYDYKPYTKPPSVSFGKPLPEKNVPNIIDLFSALLGLYGSYEPDMYRGLLYGTPGEKIPNRLITLQPTDMDLPYRVPSEFFRLNHFGLHILEGNYYKRTKQTQEVIRRMLDHPTGRITGRIQITLGELQDIIKDVFRPTDERPIILFVNACDVSLTMDKISDRDYLDASLRASHYSIAPPSGISWSLDKWPHSLTSAPVVHHREEAADIRIGKGSTGYVPPTSVVYFSPPGLGHRSSEALFSSMNGSAAAEAAPSIPYWEVPGFEPTPPEEGGDEELMGPSAAASAAAQPKSAAASSRMNEEGEKKPPKTFWGGRLKKRKTYRKKRRWLRSTNRKRTGSKRASRSSNR